jgi:hypothetical protein
MPLLLAVLAAAASATLLGWMAWRDPKRLRAQDGAGDSGAPFTTRQRRVLTMAAIVPGLLLVISGWWSSSVMWLGATVTLVWLLVLWLARAHAT